MTNQIPEEDRKKIEDYCLDNSSYEEGHTRSILREGAEFGYHLGLQSAEKRVKELEDAIGAFCVHMEKHGKANGNSYYFLFKQLLSK